MNHAPTEVILTGGDYRDNTNTFVGPITNLVLGKLKYNKALLAVTESIILPSQPIH